MKLNISPHEAGSRGISFVPDLTQSQDREIMSAEEKEAWRGLTAEIVSAVFAYISTDKYTDAGDRKNGLAFANHVLAIASKEHGSAVTLDMVVKDGFPILMETILDSVSETMLEVTTLEALLTKKLGQAEAQGVRGTVTISYSGMEAGNTVRKKVRLIGNIPTFAVMKMREIYSQLLPSNLVPVKSLGSFDQLGRLHAKKGESFDALGGRSVESLTDEQLMSLWRYINELMAKVTETAGKRLLGRQVVG